MPDLQNVRFQPIFIIGDHRSGTTLLYQLLAGTGCFNVVTAYHVIRKDEFLADHEAGRTVEAKAALTRRFRELGMENRVIDGVPVSVDLPEEYGFAIENSRRPRIHDGNLETFREFCRKVQYCGDPAKPLLLKNPWDCLSFLYVKEKFPEAKFVFIHRDPIAVVNSQLRAIRSIIAERNEYVAMLTPWYREMFRNPLQVLGMRLLFSGALGAWARMVPKHVAKAGQYYLDHIDRVPARDYFGTRYEDLCAQPDAVMNGILSFLGVTAESPQDYKQFIEPRPPRVLPEVEKRREAIRRLAQSYVQAFGY